MSLDVFFQRDIANLLTGLDRAQSVALARVGPYTDPELVAAYRAGCADTIRFVAVSFGVELPPPAKVLPEGQNAPRG